VVWDTANGLPWVLFLLRVFVGVGILLHGWPKLTHPQMGLLGQRGFAGFLQQMGFPLPGFFHLVAVLVEVGGGILLILGVFTQAVAGLLFLEMLVASYVSYRLGQPYLCVDSKGIEIDLFYAVAALVLFVAGPGVLAFG